ncbi:hypothetical protein [Embleya scabrispora]|uniref:hypothetical protein n=1 Tax=Embleya scabrispora TaxID=159449 RepID=UPI00039E414E|nr:hypothetical protein [Embleya scabrispora]MYS82434.1 hypothetical protein [Streptomyces sp. SID5474]
MSDMPSIRALFAVDAEKFTHNRDVLLPKVREAIGAVVPEAFAQAGLDWDKQVAHVDDTGDGLILTMTDDRTHQLVDAVYWLDRRLRTRARLHEGPPLRMRAAVHVGPIHVSDGSGTAKNELCRLLDDTFVRAALRATKGHVAAIVSDIVYRTAVLGGYTEAVEPGWFRRVESHVKDTRQLAWVHAPANDLPPILDPAPPAEPDRPGPADAPARRTPAPARVEPAPGGQQFHIGGNLHGNNLVGGTNHGDMNFGTDGRAHYRDPDDEPRFGGPARGV